MGITINFIKSLVGIRTHTHDTPMIAIPAELHGSAYTAGDAMGVQFFVPLPFRSGVLHSAVLVDLDNEGLQIDIVISDRQFQTPIADADAFAPDDVDALKIKKRLQFSTFQAFTIGANQRSELDNIGKAMEFKKVGGVYGVWVQAMALGASNIAAGSDPQFYLSWLADE